MDMGEECWRLAQNCARWAAENKHPNVRDAFMAMAKGWAQLAIGDYKDKVVSVADNDQSAVALLGLAGAAEQLRAAAPSIAPMVTATPQMLPRILNVSGDLQRLRGPQQGKDPH
jgi:hypothetical protein